MKKSTLAGSQPNDPVLTNMFLFQEEPLDENGFVQHRHNGNDLLFSNDCFLRNMQKYRYIANIDVDEIIIPQNMELSDMMEVLEELSQKEVYKHVQYYFIVKLIQALSSYFPINSVAQ